MTMFMQALLYYGAIQTAELSEVVMSVKNSIKVEIKKVCSVW